MRVMRVRDMPRRQQRAVFANIDGSDRCISSSGVVMEDGKRYVDDKGNMWVYKDGRVQPLSAYKDKDKDGVVNIKDCQPLNKKEQGFVHDWLKRREAYKEEKAKLNREQAKLEAKGQSYAQRQGRAEAKEEAFEKRRLEREEKALRKAAAEAAREVREREVIRQAREKARLKATRGERFRKFARKTLEKGYASATKASRKPRKKKRKQFTDYNISF